MSSIFSVRLSLFRQDNYLTDTARKQAQKLEITRNGMQKF